MLTHRTTYRVIYGDTDNMGVAYHANYLRWFEIGRAELFRFLGLTYRAIEAQGYFLPVSEAYCKFVAPARYDDLIVIQAALNTPLRGSMQFDYTIFDESGEKILVRGYTRHAFVDTNGRVVRPPGFLKQLVANPPDTSPEA